jgi:hypothetical protein
MSSEPDGHKLLIFPTIKGVPFVAMLIASSAASSAAPAPIDIATTKSSSSPLIGFGPPLTDGFVDADLLAFTKLPVSPGHDLSLCLVL